ncbi:MAG TPA: ABC transporter ATP-binding protein [Firmicutes bacterium]|jgi:branched-chain amino acid transport system ATP-binding protein|nr:ABC transporter ATP-binding protein [Bacillota bacterium]
MLSVQGINVFYGKGIHALKDLSLEVGQGEIVTLIGANGAGKSSTLNTISGLVRPRSGSVVFRDMDITKLPAHKIVEAGLCQVPEGRRIFANLTVQTNLELGAYLRKDKAAIARDMQRVYELFPRLAERKQQPAGTLSGGEQQMLAIGRALMSQPQLLMLDEPSMGLAPLLVKEIFRIVQEINRAGTTILLVEQNARMALSIAHRGYVLETGRVVMTDSASVLAEVDEVRKAYLGG